ncbi:MAG: hypothetical protein KUG81_02660 [Gammaproteobacteria bacterium]|nr:hypothetical protein [Gammaproteobacteria bacterium]
MKRFEVEQTIFGLEQELETITLSGPTIFYATDTQELWISEGGSFTKVAGVGEGSGDSNYVGASTFAELPVGEVGQTASVTDATLPDGPYIGTNPGSGGSFVVPVYYTGTGWVVG